MYKSFQKDFLKKVLNNKKPIAITKIKDNQKEVIISINSYEDDDYKFNKSIYFSPVNFNKKDFGFYDIIKIEIDKKIVEYILKRKEWFMNLIVMKVKKNDENYLIRSISYKDNKDYERIKDSLSLTNEYEEKDINDLINVLVGIRRSYDFNEIKDDFYKDINDKENTVDNLIKASGTYYKQVDFLVYQLAGILKIDEDKFKFLDDFSLEMFTDDIDVDNIM